MDWFAVGFKDAMSHVVPRPLFTPLVADMAARGIPIADFEKQYGVETAKSLGGNPKAVTEWAFDLGGGYLVGMPKETVTIDGLEIEVTCDHLGTVISYIERSMPRTFRGGPAYYKFKFWHHATVVTLDQRKRLLAHLTALYPGAEDKAMAFIEEWKRGFGGVN